MEAITISKKGNLFIVDQGDKTSDELGYDEMLGLITSLTIPDCRPCLQWMRTPEEHKARKEHIKSFKNENHEYK